MAALGGKKIEIVQFSENNRNKPSAIKLCKGAEKLGLGELKKFSLFDYLKQNNGLWFEKPSAEMVKYNKIDLSWLHSLFL